MQWAVRDADVIVTATSSSTPLFRGHWLKERAHVMAVGSYTPSARELDCETLRRAKCALLVFLMLLSPFFLRMSV